MTEAAAGAVDQQGQVIDVLLSGGRDLAAARRFFTRAVRADHLCRHAFVHNLHRGHYELATDVSATHRLPAAFDQLAMAI